MRPAQITGILAPQIAVSVVMQQILSVLGAQAFLTERMTSMGGYDAVLFTAMAIGFITPPFGLNLYLASGVTGAPTSACCATLGLTCSR